MGGRDHSDEGDEEDEKKSSSIPSTTGHCQYVLERQDPEATELISCPVMAQLIRFFTLLSWP